MEFMFLFLILPFFIYWCLNEKTGLQLSIVYLISIWAVFVCRHLFENMFINMDIRWIVIAVIFCLYLFLRGEIERLLSMGGFRICLIASAIFSFIMILYRPSFEFIILGGIFLGLGTGYCLNKRYVGFESINVLQRTGHVKFFTLFARFILGMAVLTLLVLGSEKIGQLVFESQNLELVGFICNAIIGFWVSAAAPWVFIKLRLAGSK